MKNTQLLIALAVFVLIALASAVALRAMRELRPAGPSSLKNKFKAKSFVTANELEFLFRLEAAAPELRFHAQVAMGALLDPSISRQDTKEFFRLRGMFSQKIVDYVAQSRWDGSIVALIELDDRTHNVEKDEKRDSMLKGAGYRIIRWNSKTKPNKEAIRTELVKYMVPVMRSSD